MKKIILILGLCLFLYSRYSFAFNTGFYTSNLPRPDVCNLEDQEEEIKSFTTFNIREDMDLLENMFKNHPDEVFLQIDSKEYKLKGVTNINKSQFIFLEGKTYKAEDLFGKEITVSIGRNFQESNNVKKSNYVYNQSYNQDYSPDYRKININITTLDDKEKGIALKDIISRTAYQKNIFIEDANGKKFRVLGVFNTYGKMSLEGSDRTVKSHDISIWAGTVYIEPGEIIPEKMAFVEDGSNWVDLSYDPEKPHTFAQRGLEEPLTVEQISGFMQVYYDNWKKEEDKLRNDFTERWEDKYGEIAEVNLVKLQKVAEEYKDYSSELTNERLEIIWQVARENDLDPLLFLSILIVEGTGSFNTYCISLETGNTYGHPHPNGTIEEFHEDVELAAGLIVRGVAKWENAMEYGAGYVMPENYYEKAEESEKTRITDAEGWLRWVNNGTHIRNNNDWDYENGYSTTDYWTDRVIHHLKYTIQ